jgi:hypothetical protein
VTIGRERNQLGRRLFGDLNGKCLLLLPRFGFVLMIYTIHTPRVVLKLSKDANCYNSAGMSSLMIRAELLSGNGYSVPIVSLIVLVPFKVV